MLTIEHHTDAGHGWLKFPRNAAHDLGLRKGITPYSYTDGVFYYLEEDHDAGLLMHALRLAGIEYDIVNVDDGDESPIRNMHRVRGGW